MEKNYVCIVVDKDGAHYVGYRETEDDILELSHTLLEKWIAENRHCQYEPAPDINTPAHAHANNTNEDWQCVIVDIRDNLLDTMPGIQTPKYECVCILDGEVISTVIKDLLKDAVLYANQQLKARLEDIGYGMFYDSKDSSIKSNFKKATLKDTTAACYFDEPWECQIRAV